MWHVSQQRAFQGFLLQRSVTQVRKTFGRLLESLGISTPMRKSGLKPYSLRRGGATSHFIACGSFVKVMDVCDRRLSRLNDKWRDYGTSNDENELWGILNRTTLPFLQELHDTVQRRANLSGPPAK